MNLTESYQRGIELQKKELKKEAGMYLIWASSKLVCDWEKLLENESQIPNRIFISRGDLGDLVLREVLGSELTAQNAPNSYIICNGEAVLSPRNSDGGAYAFIPRERAVVYAEAIGLTENNVYGNQKIIISTQPQPHLSAREV